MRRGNAADNRTQIFRIDYPLPKVDLLAVHEFVSRPPVLRGQVGAQLIGIAHHMSPPTLFVSLILQAED